MKKFVALMLVILMMGTLLVACGDDKSSDSSESKSGDATNAVEPSATPDEATVADATEADVVEADGDLAYVLDKGTLVVGITDFAPMDFKDENGEWIGFDADLAVEFGEYLGVDVEFTEIKWDSKILELDAKSIDCVWNGMTLTEEVTSSMSTSVPYCRNEQVVIVKSSVADNYKTADDCANLRFAVENGSAGQEQADEYGFDYIEVKDQATALMEVSAGTSEAAIIDSSMAAAMVGNGTDYSDLTVVVTLNSEEYGVGFRKGSDLTEKFNAFYAEALANGTVEEIAEIYGIAGMLIK